MNALIYLVATTIKNFIRELLRKPAKLVPYLIIIALIASGLFFSITGTSTPSSSFDFVWLTAALFAFIVLFYALAIQKGLTSGDVIFDMPDVNLLFTSPLRPQSILVYGLTRLAKSSILASVFILFQGATLASFGIGISGLVVMFIVFIVCMVSLSLLSLVLYTLTNSQPRAKMIVRIVAIVVFVPALLYFFFHLLSTEDVTIAAQTVFASPVFSAIPLVGWATSGTIGLLQGDIMGSVLWLALLLAACIGMFLSILLGRIDYYEDVLVSTETAFERRRAASEGDVQGAVATTKRNVRVTKASLKGSGASAIFYRQLRETFRQSRFGFFGITSIVILAIAIFMAILFQGSPETAGDSGFALIILILMAMQVFFIGSSKGLLELYLPHMYLIPDSSFKKVIWSNLVLVFKTLLESLLFVGIPGAILDAPPLLILSAILVYTIFSFALVGVNYFFVRWFSTSISAGLMLMLYFIIVTLVMIPGVAGALLLSSIIEGTMGLVLGFVLLGAWELLVGCVCFALSKNILTKSDMPSMRPTER